VYNCLYHVSSVGKVVSLQDMLQTVVHTQCVYNVYLSNDKCHIRYFLCILCNYGKLYDKSLINIIVLREMNFSSHLTSSMWYIAVRNLQCDILLWEFILTKQINDIQSKLEHEDILQVIYGSHRGLQDCTVRPSFHKILMEPHVTGKKIKIIFISCFLLLAHLAKGNVSFCHHLASVVVCRPLTFDILIFSPETP
jgi:hypothetical protein